MQKYLVFGSHLDKMANAHVLAKSDAAAKCMWRLLMSGHTVNGFDVSVVCLAERLDMERFWKYHGYNYFG